MTRTTFGAFCLLAILLSCGLVSAQAEEKNFDTAFNTYCQSMQGEGPKPAVCEKDTGGNWKTSVSLRWLALEEHCSSQPKDKEPCATLSEVQALKDKKSSPEPLVLAYDHVAGMWHARDRLPADRVKKDVTGKPTVSLASDEDLVVLLEHTNPLLYTLTPGEATEVDTPELADLKKLVGLLGTNISAVIKDVGAKSETAGKKKVAGKTGGNTWTEVENQLKDLENALKTLDTDVKPVQCAIEATSLQTSRIGHFIQGIELGQEASYPLNGFTGTCQSTGNANTALESQANQSFETLSMGLDQTPDPDSLCLNFLQAADNALNATKIDDIQDAILDAQASANQGVCRNDKLVKAILGDNEHPSVLLKMLQLIEKNPQPADLAKQLADLSHDSIIPVKTLVTLIGRYKDVRTAASALLLKRDDARKAAAQVDKFNGSLPQFLLGTSKQCGSTVNDQCISSADISRQIVFVNEPKPVRFDKIQNHEIKVNPNGFASAVVARQTGELKIEYALDSVIRGLWGVSASVIYTPLRDPTFSAVSDSPGAKTFHIEKTDEKTRAGQIALIMNYALGRRLCPNCGGFARAFGVEWGAGTDTDKPALFGGLSFKLGKYVRLGGGVTYQQITELKGQKVGDPVTATSDIKTRDTFKADYYLSLSVVLESLSLFSGGS